MKLEYRNPFYEKIVKQLKETIDLLRSENTKLKKNNKEIFNLKETIKKLKAEKLELSQKIIDYESNDLFYNSHKGEKEEMLLYNPNNSNKKGKSILKKSNFSFSIKGIFNKMNNSIQSNKNEEISILKDELIKKEEIISLLKSSKKGYKKVIINNFSINSSNSNSNINSNDNSAKKFMTFKNEKKISYNNNSLLSNKMKNKISNKNISTFSLKDNNNNNKRLNPRASKEPSLEDCDSQNSLEKNIFKEIQNILEEKRNFILNTLTRENFSFDILRVGNDKNKLNLIECNIKDFKETEEIDKLLELIKNRKIKVQKIKKYFEDRLI